MEAAVAAWGIALGWGLSGVGSCMAGSESSGGKGGAIEVPGWSSQLALQVVAVWWLVDVVWVASWKAALWRQTISSISTTGGGGSSRANCREADAVSDGGVVVGVAQGRGRPTGLAGRCGQWLACAFNRKLLKCAVRIDDEVNSSKVICNSV